jgi:hypothetical protein
MVLFMGITKRHILLTLIVLVVVALIIGICLAFYLARHGVIFRGQKLIEVADDDFIEKCIKDYEERISSARESLAQWLSKDHWTRNPTTTLILKKGESLNTLLARVKEEYPYRPVEIIVEPGTYEEVVQLPDGIILTGRDRESCVFKADGIDYGKMHNILFLVPAGQQCAFNNLTLINTHRDYPSMALRIMDGSKAFIDNCTFISEGNDTLTLNPDSYTAVRGSYILGNSDCVSSYGNADFWNCYIDPTHRGGGTNGLWIGGNCHVYFENCQIRSTNGIINPSAVGRSDTDNSPFNQQVTLINCTALRTESKGRFFSVSGPVDGLYYRYSDFKSPIITHINSLVWLETEPGGIPHRQYIHDVQKGKVFTPAR